MPASYLFADAPASIEDRALFAWDSCIAPFGGQSCETGETSGADDWGENDGRNLRVPCGRLSSAVGSTQLPHAGSFGQPSSAVPTWRAHSGPGVRSSTGHACTSS